MSDFAREIAVNPTVTYPREAQLGKTYLMTIDLQSKEANWHYEEEEYPVYCSVDSELFSSKSVGEPVIVLHRFGGSYGEAKFWLTAISEKAEGKISVALVNRWGVLVNKLILSDIHVLQKQEDNLELEESLQEEEDINLLSLAKGITDIRVSSTLEELERIDDFSSKNVNPRRMRGVVLTQQGIDRLEAAIVKAQDKEKYGKSFTQVELSERVNLSIKTIKKIRDRTAPVDEVSVRTLFEAFGDIQLNKIPIIWLLLRQYNCMAGILFLRNSLELSLESADYGLPELPSSSSESKLAPQDNHLTTKIDWGEKPDTAIFFGRTEDLTTLTQWVTADQCRLVTLLGMGGIGKTSLAAKLADHIYERFDYVIWRSLREAPPLDEILVRIIQFLSDQQETEINLPMRLEERIIRLLHYLRKYRCLLVLDNLDSILQAESTGQFRNGYEGYEELIHRIGGAEHQSCLLLTSRECPRELALMAGDYLPVRLWSVDGIDSEAGQEILKAKGLNLEDADNQGQELIRLYSGNPQALNLVATAIRREYLGDVDDFLEEEGAALEDVRSLLDQHLTRLAPLERSILFWLAINREPVGVEELMEDLLQPVSKRDVRSALTGLYDRYLIEATGKRFTLQNVIMEFA
ncbi:MAG: NB-ARC domain-containing protein, partial [Cyanobacteria bacterium P01_F01_bin.86]